MKSSIAAVFLMGAFAVSATAATHPVATLDAAFGKAMLAGDSKALGACYAEDAVMYPPDAQELRGRAAIVASFDELLKAYKVTKFDYVVGGYADSSSTSSSWGTWTMTMTPKAGGEAVTLTGRATSVAKKIGGKWLYVADHASETPKPPPPAK